MTLDDGGWNYITSHLNKHVVSGFHLGTVLERLRSVDLAMSQVPAPGGSTERD